MGVPVGLGVLVGFGVLVGVSVGVRASVGRIPGFEGSAGFPKTIGRYRKMVWPDRIFDALLARVDPMDGRKAARRRTANIKPANNTALVCFIKVYAPLVLVCGLSPVSKARVRKITTVR